MLDAGGLDLAVEAVFGGETVWHCENDPAASKVLAARWPGVPNLHDITAVDWSTVEPVDVLCGGWPCQPFSLAGRRKGADDERALWPYVAGAVRMVRPRIVVLENVSAVLGPEFTRVTNDLAALGYDIAWTCLRASDVSAPHRRERLFVVAHTNGATVRQPTRGASTEEARLLPSDRPSDSGGERVARNGWPTSDSEGDSGWIINRDSGTALANSPRVGWHEGWPESARLIGGSDAAVSGAGPVDLLPTPNASDCTGGGAHPDNREGHSRQLIDFALLHGSPQWGKYEPAIRRWESLTRPAPAPTEPNTKGNPRLAAAFSEWMMGWPVGWVTAVSGISRNDALRIIGNGVVPQQATAALQWLLSVSEDAA